MINKRFKGYIYFLNSSIVANLFIMVSSILTRRFVAPSEYGLYVTISLFATYAAYLQMGVLNAVNFEIPYYRAQDKTDKIQIVKGSALAYCVIASGLVVFLLILLILINSNTKVVFGLIITAFSIITTFILTFIENVLRGEERFTELSKLTLLRTSFQALACIIFSYFFGYYGLYIGLPLATVIGIISKRKILNGFNLNFNINAIKERVSIGFPIFLTGTLFTFLISTSQMIASISLTPKEVGEYSIAILTYNTAMIIPILISQIVYPKFAGKIGETNEPRQLKKLIFKTESIYYWVMAFFVCCGIIIMPLIVTIFLPDYTEGILPAQIILLAVFFISSNVINSNALIVVQKSKELMIILAISILVKLIIGFILVFPLGMIGISLSDLITFILFSLLIHLRVSKLLQCSIVEKLVNKSMPVLIIIIPFLLFYYCFDNRFHIISIIWITISLYIIVVKSNRINEGSN